MRSRRALDWLNFFLADVQSGLGPFIGIYLLTEEHWDAARIGIVMTIAGLATIAAQTPAGALIDATRRKRGVIVAAASCVSAAAVIVTLAPSFPVIAAAQLAMGAAAAVFPPAIAAIALGLVGPRLYTRLTGRMQAFNHAGNVVAAVLSGIIGTLIATAGVFWLIAGLGAFAILAALAIDGRAIDHDLARGLHAGSAAEEEAERPSGFRVLLRCRPLLVFAASIMLFHLANAAMLPLMGQELALGNSGEGALFMSLLIIVAQAVMVPMSVLVGRRADRWGRKAIFLAAFASLPLRGVLFTLSADPAYLIAVQVLDGVGAGIFGALFPIVIADLTRGTGRYNLAQGATATLQGIGAALSTTLAGVITVAAGYNAAFLALAAIGLLAGLLFLLAMPETLPRESRAAPTASPRPSPEAAAP